METNWNDPVAVSKRMSDCGPSRATERQVTTIYAMADQRGMDWPALRSVIKEVTGSNMLVTTLDYWDADRVIERLLKVKVPA